MKTVWRKHFSTTYRGVISLDSIKDFIGARKWLSETN